jgi:hypothetical protein
VRQAREGVLQILEVEMRALMRLHRQRRRVLAVRVLDLAPALAVFRVEQVAQDGEQPGLHVGARLEAVDIRDRPHERLLHEVVGTVDVRGQRDREGAQVRRRPEHDVAKVAVDGHELFSLGSASSRRLMISMNRSGTGCSPSLRVS